MKYLVLVAAILMPMAASAESLNTARANIDALSDAQLVEEVVGRIRAQGCEFSYTSRDDEKRFQKEVKAALFDKAGVSNRHRDKLEDVLHDRIDDVMDDQIESGEIVVNQKRKVVTVSGC